MNKEKSKIRVFIYGNMLLGLVLGVYGQSISYYINNNMFKLSLSDCLTVVTTISILLFLIPPIFVYKSNKKQNIKKEELYLYFGINILIGIMTSIWSLFILIMWWS